MSEVPIQAPEAPDPTAGRIRSALQRIIDPELHINIVDLGLVYGVSFGQGVAQIRMTLTSPGCPYGPYLLHSVKTATRSIPGVTRVNVEVVWEPPWGPDKMSEDVRLQLGFDI